MTHLTLGLFRLLLKLLAGRRLNVVSVSWRQYREDTAPIVGLVKLQSVLSYLATLSNAYALSYHLLGSLLNPFGAPSASEVYQLCHMGR